MFEAFFFLNFTQIFVFFKVTENDVKLPPLLLPWQRIFPSERSALNTKTVDFLILF